MVSWWPLDSADTFHVSSSRCFKWCGDDLADSQRKGVGNAQLAMLCHQYIATDKTCAQPVSRPRLGFPVWKTTPSGRHSLHTNDIITSEEDPHFQLESKKKGTKNRMRWAEDSRENITEKFHKIVFVTMTPRKKWLIFSANMKLLSYCTFKRRWVKKMTIKLPTSLMPL